MLDVLVRCIAPTRRTLVLCTAFLSAICALPAHGDSIAGGGSHSLLLRDDGTVWAWGGNNNGQLGDGTLGSRAAPIPVLSGAQAIAAGIYHSLAIKTDGSLWSWGNNSLYQLGDGTSVARTTPVHILDSVRAVAGGYGHSLAIRTDGTLWAWGYNISGQVGDGTLLKRPAPVSVMSGVRAVAAGRGHSLAIRDDSTLWAWGDNEKGQLGDGTTLDHTAPVQVMTGVQAIATDWYHSLALKSDGTLWAWGDNSQGQLGDGSVVNRATPVQVLSGVRAIAAGYSHSVALKNDGTLWAWGYNGYGQLGDGTLIRRSTPMLVASGVIAIAAGWYHSMAIKTDGVLLAWGDNTHGQVGDGSIVHRAAPTLVLNDAQAVAAGFGHSLALRTDGTLLAWGNNGYGQLGDGTMVDRAAPVAVLTGVSAIAAGTRSTFALKIDGTLWAWGENFYGQLGDGSTTDRAAPVQVLSGVSAIAAGDSHTLALKTDGTVWAWGFNLYGQLGDGTKANRSLPFQVTTGIRAIAAGGNHSLALASNGTLRAWGYNTFGQLGDGTNTNRPTPVQVTAGVESIAAGANHTLAIRTGGTLWAWGQNAYGQLGDGTTISRWMPVPVLNAVQSAVGGERFSLAVTASGALLHWGAIATPGTNGATRPQLHPLLRKVVRAAAGSIHAIVITAQGRALAWGDNSAQQLGVAHQVRSPVPIEVRDPLAPEAGADLVVEFFNPTIRNGAGTSGAGHHFITAVTAESASIDAGGSGPGWSRTGRTFRAWIDPEKAPPAAVAVCRFYAREPNSHFYTASTAECQSLRDLNPANDPNLGWSYEGIAFYTVLPTGGSCRASFYPVYRSYNNRFDANPALNDGNHRITPSYNDYQRSIRFFNYADEGIAFCAPAVNNAGDLQVTYSYPGTTVQSGAPVLAEFVFGNNGGGNGNGGSVYFSLPDEVTDWVVTCTARNGATCPATTDLIQLREGQGVPSWPAGGTLTFTATGTAPQVTADGDATLRFAATVANATGRPDSTPANDTPPLAQTVVKAAAVCNTAVNPDALQLGPSAQTPHVSVFVGTGCAWVAQTDAPWLTVAPAAGNGDTVLTLTLAANPSTAERSGSVHVNGRKIAVTQTGIICTFDATPATLTFTSAGQSSAVALAVSAGCGWSAQSDSSWLAVGPAGGNGNGSLTITVDANSEPGLRSGSVTVGSLVIPVTQSGAIQVAPQPLAPVDPCATLRLQREGDQVASGGFTGSQSFDVIADGQCAWSAQSNAAWVTLTTGTGVSGNGTVSYLVEANGDPQLRSGTIRVGAKLFTINQLGHVQPGPGGDTGGGDSGGDGGGASSGGAAG